MAKTQHGRDLSGEEMAQMLDEFCNGSGEKEKTEFVEQVVSRTHRTLQQKIAGLMVATLEAWAECYVKHAYDGRNEATCKLAKRMIDASGISTTDFCRSCETFARAALFGERRTQAVHLRGTTTMKIIISLTIDYDESRELEANLAKIAWGELNDENVVHTTLRDAMAEFIASRAGGNAEDYVAERYPTWTGKQRDDQIAMVKKRLQVARRLRNADVKVST